jgi:hypothetical protein
MNVINYKVYDQDEVKERLKKGDRILLGSVEYLKYALVFTPKWSLIKDMDYCVAHLDFMALSGGWESFTSTGYKSHFIQGDLSMNLTNENVINIFNDLLKQSAFDIAKTRQLDLFS